MRWLKPIYFTDVCPIGDISDDSSSYDSSSDSDSDTEDKQGMMCSYVIISLWFRLVWCVVNSLWFKYRGRTMCIV